MTPVDLAELQFFPSLLGSILHDGVGDASDPEAIRCGALLGAARSAPATRATPKVKNAAQRLLSHAVAAFRAPYVAEETSVALTGLIADRMMGEIIRSGYLILHPGSDMDQAMKLIRAGLEDVVDDAMRARAEEEWLGALERVKGAGLFEGVNVVEGRAPLDLAA